MTRTLTPTFVDALDELGVDHTRTTPADCPDAIAAAVDGEAVAIRLDEGLDLPTGVVTDPTNGELEGADTGVTPGAFGIAETGSVYLPADAAGTEPVSLYPYRHVAVLRERDLVADVPAAIERFAPLLRDGGSGIVATGPSATADMGELIVGAHGPGEVHVILVGESDTDAEPRADPESTGVDDA